MQTKALTIVTEAEENVTANPLSKVVSTITIFSKSKSNSCHRSFFFWRKDRIVGVG